MKRQPGLTFDSRKGARPGLPAASLSGARVGDHHPPFSHSPAMSNSRRVSDDFIPSLPHPSVDCRGQLALSSASSLDASVIRWHMPLVHGDHVRRLLQSVEDSNSSGLHQIKAHNNCMATAQD
ncbi:hypothetical protein LIA77_07570 [Sarocladium implicatum]|nr:hypothetical protein LIA77_07570 [Sarocladium implicatum]